MLLYPLLWVDRPFALVARVVPSFAAGMLLARLATAGDKAAITPRRRLFLGTLVAAAIALILVTPFALEHPVMWMLAAFPALIYGLGDGRWNVPLFAWGPVVYLGEISYSLYMTHAVVQKPINLILERTAPISASLPVRVATAAAILGVIVAAALLSYYLVERPGRRAVRRLTRRAEPARVDGAQAVGVP